MSDTRNGLLEALKARMQPPPSVVLAVPGVFSAEAVLNALSGKLSEAENTLAEAKVEHRKAALDEQKKVPGAAARKSAALAALKEAQGRIDDLLAAQIAADLEKRENALRERHAKEEVEDAACRLAGAEYLAEAKRYAETIKTFADGWARLRDAEKKLYGLLTRNPRTQNNYMPSLGGVVGPEVARVARRLEDSSRLLFPDVPDCIQQLGAASQLPPMVNEFEAAMKALNIELDRAAAARAKARK